MKTIKAKYYLIPIVISLLLVTGLIYYYFLSDFSHEEVTQYVYIDDNDTEDSVFIKLI